jgi:hypothetical protein
MVGDQTDERTVVRTTHFVYAPYPSESLGELVARHRDPLIVFGQVS